MCHQILELCDISSIYIDLMGALLDQGLDNGSSGAPLFIGSSDESDSDVDLEMSHGWI